MMKKMVKMVMVAMAAVATITGAHTQAQAAPKAPTQYTQVYRDMEGSDLTLKRTERMVKYVERHIWDIHPGHVYNIEKFKGFDVMVILNKCDRASFFKVATERTRPLVVIEYGFLDNAQGDGTTGDGCYIGYRIQGQPMAFNLHRGIRTITVMPGTDQYTDSVALRKDTQR